MKFMPLVILMLTLMMQADLAQAAKPAWICSTSCSTENSIPPPSGSSEVSTGGLNIPLGSKPAAIPASNSDATLTSQCSGSGVSTKHAINALKAKLMGKNRNLEKQECDRCMPVDIESAICKNSKSGQSKSYGALKLLFGDGPHGEKSKN